MRNFLSKMLEYIPGERICDLHSLLGPCPSLFLKGGTCLFLQLECFYLADDAGVETGVIELGEPDRFILAFSFCVSV